MKSDDTKNFLISMCDAVSISGYESGMAEMLRTEFSKYCDEVSIDRYGSVVGVKKGDGKLKVMFAAHMDEIGLIVSNIDDRGFLKFSTIGGYDQRTLLSQEVIVHGREDVFGVIGLKPPHLTTEEDRKKSVSLAEMSIDTGYDNHTVRKLVKVGDIVSIRRKAQELQNEMISGKSLDDKAGVAALLECMKNLRNYRHTADLYFVATAQEETSFGGATTAANIIEPHIGIAIDVGFARMDGLKETDTIEMGKGPAICIGPNIHYDIFTRLKETAVNNDIAYQLKSEHGMSMTDAIPIQTSGAGVQTGLLSIPLKYMHTSVETVYMKDIYLTGRLLAQFVESLSGCETEVILCS